MLNVCRLGPPEVPVGFASDGTAAELALISVRFPLPNTGLASVMLRLVPSKKSPRRILELALIVAGPPKVSTVALSLPIVPPFRVYGRLSLTPLLAHSPPALTVTVTPCVPRASALALSRNPPLITQPE